MSVFQPETGKTVLWDVLFLILFTGPPKFRVREAEASLSGDLDFATILQLIIWTVVGIFVVYRFIKARRDFRITGLHALAFGMIAILGASSLYSFSPGLTAFKSMQVVVCFLFCWIYVERFGTDHFFHMVLIGSLILCALTVLMYFISPESVITVESTGESRLRGQAIYEVSHPALFSVLLLLTHGTLRFRWRALLLIFSGAVLVVSLARIDWAAAAVVVALALVRRPEIPGLKIVRSLVWFSPLLAYGVLEFLAKARDLGSILDLSERGGLWLYIIAQTAATSPMLGNGFIAASRITGIEYMSTLASGHSIFIDIFAGCGLVGLGLFLLLVVFVAVKSFSLLTHSRDNQVFVAAALFLAMMMVGSFGAEVEATPFGFLFWGLIPSIALIERTTVVSRGRSAFKLTPRLVFVSSSVLTLLIFVIVIVKYR